MDTKTTLFAFALVIILAWRNVAISKISHKSSPYDDIFSVVRRGVDDCKKFFKRISSNAKHKK